MIKWGGGVIEVSLPQMQHSDVLSCSLCLHVCILTLLKCSNFFSGTIECNKRFIAVVDLPGGVLQFAFLHYLFEQLKVLFDNFWI